MEFLHTVMEIKRSRRLALLINDFEEEIDCSKCQGSGGNFEEIVKPENLVLLDMRPCGKNTKMLCPTNDTDGYSV